MQDYRCSCISVALCKDNDVIAGLKGLSGRNSDTAIPQLMLSYVECHDNCTLFDKLAMSYLKIDETHSGPDEENRVAPADIPDYDEISNRFKHAVLNAYAYGITNGVDANRTFNPKGELTRAQICQLFCNMGWTK